MPGNRYFSMLSDFPMTQNWKFSINFSNTTKSKRNIGKIEDFLEINGIIEENPKIGLSYRKIENYRMWEPCS